MPLHRVQLLSMPVNTLAPDHACGVPSPFSLASPFSPRPLAGFTTSGTGASSASACTGGRTHARRAQAIAYIWPSSAVCMTSSCSLPWSRASMTAASFHSGLFFPGCLASHGLPLWVRRDKFGPARTLRDPPPHPPHPTPYLHAPQRSHCRQEADGRRAPLTPCGSH